MGELRYVALPIIPGTKRPHISWPPGGGLRTVEEVDKAWAKHPDADVGLMPDESGLLVVDGDGAVGMANARALIGEELSLLALQATTERGRHWYFEHPGGYVKPSNGILAPGVDIKASRAIVVVPPSRGRRWAQPRR